MDTKSMDTLKKAGLVFGVGFLIFLIVRPKQNKSLDLSNPEIKADDPSERSFVGMPTMDAKTAKTNPKAASAAVLLKAYISAYNNKEPQTVLDQMNKDFAQKKGMVVYQRRQDKKWAVKDLSGKDIIIND